MNIAVLKEKDPLESRVGLSPKVIKRLTAKGYEVVVEQGAGVSAGFDDKDYVESGAKIAKSSKDVLSKADMIVKVNSPGIDSSISDRGKDELSEFKAGQTLICLLSAMSNSTLLEELAKKKIEAYALEMIPRISMAQSMDVLSSQANLAGYRAVIEALSIFEKAAPMMTTAAGSIPPAKAFIMGTGVAGLQAIATAKRIGAVVSATDVRPSTKDQVTSLGASFIAVMDEEFEQAQTAGGYAKPMSKQYMKKQAELIKETLASQDLVITTALIPGREAPLLIDDEMLGVMQKGSVIIDLAAASGGNTSQTVKGKNHLYNGIYIVDGSHLTSKVANTASQLFAQNIEKFLELFEVVKDKDEKNQAKKELSMSILNDTKVVSRGKITIKGYKPESKTSKPKPKKKTTSKKTTGKRISSEKNSSKEANR